jgi:hypothetical protein
MLMICEGKLKPTVLKLAKGMSSLVRDRIVDADSGKRVESALEYSLIEASIPVDAREKAERTQVKCNGWSQAIIARAWMPGCFDAPDLWCAKKGSESAHLKWVHRLEASYKMDLSVRRPGS